MERLTDAVELLDGPLDDPAVLAGNLRDLRRINRWLGGTSLSAAAIEAVAAHRAELTLLDVGTGGGDIPRALLALGRTARPPAVRRRASTAGPRSSPWPAAPDPRPPGTDRLELQVGDGRSLPVPGSLVRCRPCLARPPPLRSGRPRPSCSGRWAASPGWASSSTTCIASRLGWLGAWLLGHLLTREPVHPPRRDHVGAAGVPAGRDGRAAARRRPDPGADDPRRVRPALRDRGRGRPGRSSAPTAPVGPANDRAGRGRDRRRRAVRCRPRGTDSRGPATRWSSSSGCPTWRWHAGGVFTSPAAVTALRRAGLERARAAGRRPADPGDAGRDRRRDHVPAHVRRGHGRRACRRVRPVAPGSGAPRPGRAAPAPTSGSAGRSRRSIPGPAGSTSCGAGRIRGAPPRPGRRGCRRAAVRRGPRRRRRRAARLGARIGLTYHLPGPGSAGDAGRADAPAPGRLRRDRAGRRAAG